MVAMARPSVDLERCATSLETEKNLLVKQMKSCFLACRRRLQVVVGLRKSC